MSLATQASPLAKRRAMNFITAISAKAFGRLILTAFFTGIQQFLGAPDLLVAEFSGLNNTDVVVAGEACSVYAIFMKVPTAVTGFFKGTNHATTCATNGSQDVSVLTNKIGETILLFPNKLAMSAGFTIRGNTTATGNTDPNAADKIKGFVIVGS